jgi:hypothetical protein
VFLYYQPIGGWTSQWRTIAFAFIIGYREACRATFPRRLLDQDACIIARGFIFDINDSSVLEWSCNQRSMYWLLEP